MSKIEAVSAALTEDAVEAFIREIPWTMHATDHERALVSGNIRNFAYHLRNLITPDDLSRYTK